MSGLLFKDEFGWSFIIVSLELNITFEVVDMGVQGTLPPQGGAEPVTLVVTRRWSVSVLTRAWPSSLPGDVLSESMSYKPKGSGAHEANYWTVKCQRFYCQMGVGGNFLVQSSRDYLIDVRDILTCLTVKNLNMYQQS